MSLLTDSMFTERLVPLKMMSSVGCGKTMQKQSTIIPSVSSTKIAYYGHTYFYILFQEIR